MVFCWVGTISLQHNLIGLKYNNCPLYVCPFLSEFCVQIEQNYPHKDACSYIVGAVYGSTVDDAIYRNISV